MKLNKEESLQAEFIIWLNQNYKNVLYTHPPNGGKRAKTFAIKLKLIGVRAGVPDLLIFDRKGKYNGMALEFKQGNNTCTEAQLHWLEKLRERGWFTCVCYDIETAIKHTQYYFSL